jgi:hypothetical protein
MESLPFALISDVAEQLGPIDSSDTDMVNGLLRRASAIIRLQATGIDLRIAQGLIGASTVTDIAADMVIRVLRNQDGVSQETIGPTAVTYDPQVASGRLFLTPDELFMLQPPTATRAAVGTIGTQPALNPRAAACGPGGSGSLMGPGPLGYGPRFQ